MSKQGRLDLVELTLGLLLDAIDRHLTGRAPDHELQQAARQARAILQGDD